jgi:hypothetical protein
MMRGQSVINLSLASKLGPNCGRQVNFFNGREIERDRANIREGIITLSL